MEPRRGDMELSLESNDPLEIYNLTEKIRHDNMKMFEKDISN